MSSNVEGAAFGHIKVGSDLSEEDADVAAESRESFEGLLKRIAHVSAPNTGCASVFIALGRLASTACDWLDGDLCVELLDVDASADGDSCTELRLMTELGGGMRERVFAPITMRVPLAELINVLEVNPTLVGAMRIHRRSWKRVTLDATEIQRRSTSPPRISNASLIALRQSSIPTKAEAAADSKKTGEKDDKAQ